MHREIEDFLPLITLLAPDEDLAVVTCRGEDVAVFWVGPRDAPYCSFMAVYFALAKKKPPNAHVLPF
jgi:hypothetical protein